MARLRAEHPDLAPYLCESPEEVADGADALALLTAWPQYLDLDWAKLGVVMRGTLVYDGRHVLDRQRILRAGLRYLA
jgi:UDPglucose 6-dehydrogenase